MWNWYPNNFFLSIDKPSHNLNIWYKFYQFSSKRNFKTREFVKYQIAFSKITEKVILENQNLRKSENQAEKRLEEFKRCLKRRLLKSFMNVGSYEWNENQKWFFSSDCKDQIAHVIYFRRQEIIQFCYHQFFSSTEKRVIHKYHSGRYFVNYLLFISNVRKIWRKNKRFWVE